jgi:DNA-binding LytR/AlgR family response regulator
MTTSAPLRAVLADDERLLRDQLRAQLRQAWPTLDIVAEAKNGEEAVALVQAHHPDVVFLDIRMPGMSGIDAARAIAHGADDEHPLPEIVFVTAYDAYAVAAFEQGAADYVLKPADPDRLALTAARVQARCHARREGNDEALSAEDAPSPLQQVLHRLRGPDAPPPLRWIQASVGASIQMIAVDEVLFFISDEKYTRVQTATTEALIRKPIKELVDELDPERFWQIHRSTLVNVSAIANVSRDLRGRQIVMVRGRPDKLEVSRSYIGLFKGM